MRQVLLVDQVVGQLEIGVEDGIRGRDRSAWTEGMGGGEWLWGCTRRDALRPSLCKGVGFFVAVDSGVSWDPAKRHLG